MIDLLINLLVLLANVVAAVLIFHSFGKDTDKNKKITYTLIIVGAMYIVTLVIYFLSGIGIKKAVNTDTYRMYMMMAFVPVNLMILIPFTIYSCMETKRKKLKMKNLNNRLLIIEIVAIILIIGEFIYFRNAQKNLKRMQDEAINSTANNVSQNEILNEYMENYVNNTALNENLANEIQENVVDTNSNNEVLDNELINEINNTEVDPAGNDDEIDNLKNNNNENKTDENPSTDEETDTLPENTN